MESSVRSLLLLPSSDSESPPLETEVFDSRGGELALVVAHTHTESTEKRGRGQSQVLRKKYHVQKKRGEREGTDKVEPESEPAWVASDRLDRHVLEERLDVLLFPRRKGHKMNHRSA